MFKTIKTNLREIGTILLLITILIAGLYYARTVFPPLAYILDLVWYLLIVALVFFLPWVFISITMPNTMGRFINVWFEEAWKSIGKDPSFMVTKPGPSYGESAENKTASALTTQLYLTLAVYAVLVVAGALVAFAAFAKGITIVP